MCSGFTIKTGLNRVNGHSGSGEFWGYVKPGVRSLLDGPEGGINLHMAQSDSFSTTVTIRSSFWSSSFILLIEQNIVCLFVCVCLEPPLGAFSKYFQNAVILILNLAVKVANFIATFDFDSTLDILMMKVDNLRRFCFVTTCLIDTALDVSITTQRSGQSPPGSIDLPVR